MTDLTPRQRDVLQMVYDGLQTKEIAKALGLSSYYVKNIEYHLRDG